MAEHDLDALVVRAPDNVLYLTNFWGMKGYDAVVFPREGEPIADLPRGLARRTPSARAWTQDVRLFARLRRARPAAAVLRALDAAREAAPPYGRVGLELSLGTQASDRMVGEPTTFTKAWFDAFPDAVDATPLLADARARSRPSRRSRGCGSRTRSPRRRWSTSRSASSPG